MITIASKEHGHFLTSDSGSSGNAFHNRIQNAEAISNFDVKIDFEQIKLSYTKFSNGLPSSM